RHKDLIGAGTLRRLALTPDGLRALVTRRDAHDVAEVNVNRSGAFGQITPIPIAGDPDGIAVSPSGRRAYVTDATDSLIYELDTDLASVTQRTVLREIRVGEARLTGGVAVDRTGRSVLFSTGDQGSRGVDLGSAFTFALHGTASAGGIAITPSAREALF